MKQRRLTIIPERASIRAEVIDGKQYFVGYASVYNSKSRLIIEMGRVFYEFIRPGAFDRILQDPALDVFLALDHEELGFLSNLARTKSGTLELESDETGLLFRALVPDTQAGRDTFTMVSRGDFTDCSFMFSVEEDGEDWQRDADGSLLHIVNRVSALYDVTICTRRGAYEETIIDVERASRMYKDLQIGERAEPDGNGNPDPDNPDPDKPDPDGGSNDNPDQEEREEIETQNDLDEMIVGLHKTKSGSGSSL